MDLMINVLQTDRWVVSTGGRGVGGGGRWIYCHIWAMKVCAAVKCMVFKQFTLELLAFGVTPFKIHVDQNRNQNCSIDKVQNLGSERR